MPLLVQTCTEAGARLVADFFLLEFLFSHTYTAAVARFSAGFGAGVCARFCFASRVYGWTWFVLIMVCVCVCVCVWERERVCVCA